MHNQEQSIKFKGKMVLSGDSEVPVTAIVTFDKLDATSLDIEIMLMAHENEIRSIQAKLYSDQNNNIFIENEWDKGAHLEINDIYGISQSSGGLRIDANSMSYGVKGQHVTPDDKLYLNAKFTPSGLLGKELGVMRHYDGNIKIRKMKFKDAYWETDIGTYNIYKAHEHFEDEIFERKALKSVEATHAHIEIVSSKLISLEEIRKKAIAHLEIISSALSLSSRVPVRLYELSYSIIEKEREARNFFFPKIQRFKLLENQKKVARDPLIEIRNLSGKKFHHLASKIQTSNVSKALRKSIHFLALSRTKYLEESYFLCFLALDSIVEEVLKGHNVNTTIPSGPWKKIEKFLSTCIKKNETKALEKYFSEIKVKFPELKRYAFNKKVLQVVKLLRVNTDGIWAKQSFIDGLKEATKIRNNLFHSGHVDSVESMHSNLIRLQYLSERIILKALQWRQSQLWVWQDQELKGINMS